MPRPFLLGQSESDWSALDAALVPTLDAALEDPVRQGSSLPPLLPAEAIAAPLVLQDNSLFPMGVIERLAAEQGRDRFAGPQPLALGAIGVNVAIPGRAAVDEATARTSDETATDLILAPELQPADNSAPALQDRLPFASYSGELTYLDEYNPQRFATFKDDYILSVTADGTVGIDLRSSEFDAYLQLLRVGSNEVVAFNDDFGQSFNSQLNLQVAEGDRFIVRVTSYSPGATGQYRIELSSGDAAAQPGAGNDPGSNDEPTAPVPPVSGSLQPDPSQFRSGSGYGLVDAAAAVAAALNLAQPERTEPFAEAPDLGGFEQPLDVLRVPEAWAQGFTGNGVTIAVVDSGLDLSHPEFRDRLWTNSDEIAGDGIDNDQNGYVDDVNGWNFGRGQFNNRLDPGTNFSSQGHGTHVAGIVAGANNGNGNTGVAYDAQIMALRLGDTDSDGVFTNPGSLASAVRYAVDNGADVVNLSLGWSDSFALRSALAYAAENDVVVVGASGNSGLSNPGNPARYAVNWGLSVGAVTTNGRLTSFSNGAGFNAEIRHVVAPGNRIVSAEPGGGYGTRSGTSMATPYVSGVVALMLSANPDITQNQVRDILAATTQSIA